MDTNALKDRARLLRDAAQKRALDTIRESEVKMRILDLLGDVSSPGTLEFVHGQGYRCDGSVRFTATTADIQGMMVAFQPVEIGLYRGAFTSLFPVSRATDKDPSVVRIAPFLVQVEKVGDYPFTVSVEWWAQLGGFLLKIEAKVLDGHAWASLKDVPDRANNGRLIRHNWRCQIEKPGYRVIVWSTPNQPAPRTFYWADPDTRWEDL